MGFKLDAPTIVGVVSACIGIGLLVTSCLVLAHHGSDEGISAGVLGLIASLLQIGSILCILYDNMDIWFYLHIAVFVLSIIAFSLSAHYYIDTGSGRGEPFFAFTLMSWIWCVLGAGAVYFFSKK